jgi:hypothetical protein
MSDSNSAMIGLDAFDSAAAADEGATMEVRSPTTGEVMYWPDGRPWTITYFGADSERVKKATRQQQDRRSQAMMRSRTAIQAAVMEKDNIEILVVATKNWDIPMGDGTPAPCDPKEYRAAYTKYPWLSEQGNEFAGSRSNFLKSS